tara:strand:+ start:290 stop:802 length:513 start_codon:yes stop_codon:yes gene_type:complete
MISSLKLKSADGSLQVIVEDNCLQHWDKHRQRRFWQPEVGGLLFAPSVGSVDGCVCITTITGPHSSDRGKRYSLLLDHERCLSDIELQFSRGLHFVGYWHTHPERAPALSGVDLKAFHEILKSGGVLVERFIAVVVGIQSCDSVYLVEKDRATQLVDNSGDCAANLTGCH